MISSLGTYLNDHFAGPAFAIAAAENRLQHTKQPELKPFLERFIQELRQERTVLRRVIESMGYSVSLTKALGAWVGEKAIRLKVMQALEGHGPLTELEQLETLRLGVQGKRGLWALLQKLSRSEPRLRGFDFKGLARQADDQIEALERFRLRAGVTLAHPEGRPETEDAAHAEATP